MGGASGQAGQGVIGHQRKTHPRRPAGVQHAAAFAAGATFAHVYGVHPVGVAFQQFQHRLQAGQQIFLLVGISRHIKMISIKSNMWKSPDFFWSIERNGFSG